MCDCDCVCLFFVSGWVLDCSFSWISLGPPSNGVSARWYTCGSQCPGLGALVCAGSLPVTACRGLNPWALSDLHLGGDVSRGLWVHGRTCSGVDSCRRGLWARRCSCLGLLHLGCWVVPLAPSPDLLWGGCGSPGGGSPGVPVLWGTFGCLWLGSPPYPSQVQDGRSVAPHTQYCIFLWRNLVYTSALTLRPTGF
ncbi:hypothetical protein ILYODFUR_026280 [Ilyodon furcidens]|uniref:Uncharacterized protein n=1 Tax=Ilyodon furcidens TaxID=33524 RepID=A0ABV0U8L1_9TELE